MSRIHRPGAIVFVTVSVLGRRCSLLPNRAFNARAGALLAIAQDRYGMGIIEYCFMSNHIHLQLKINHVTQLACFMRDLNSGLARVAKAVHGGGVGIFWSGRYHSVELGTEWEVADKGRYIRAHGVKEGLVENPLEWPGLSSLKQRADPAECTPAGWRLCRGCRRRKAVAKGCKKCGQVAVRLSVRPGDEGLSTVEIGEVARDEAAKIEVEYARSRSSGVLGVSQVLSQNPWAAPSEVELSQTVKRSCTFMANDVDPVVAKATLGALTAHYECTEEARKAAVVALLEDGLSSARFPAGAVVPHIVPQATRLKLATAAVAASIDVESTERRNPNYSANGARHLVERCRAQRERSPPGIDS